MKAKSLPGPFHLAQFILHEKYYGPHKMMTKTQINKLIKMMNDLDYPFEAPLKESFIESIIQINLILIQLIAWRSYVMKLVFF